jgi:hypothetical protein
MSKDEITRGVLDLLADIAKREKQKAINKDEYFDAFLATLFEVGLEMQENHSMKRTERRVQVFPLSSLFFFFCVFANAYRRF